MSAGGDIVIELKLDGKHMEVGIKNAGQLLRQFQGTLSNTARSVRRLEEAHFSLGTSFRNLIITLGNLRFALMDVYDAFLRLPVAILRSAGELERMQMLLKGLSTAVTDAGKNADGKRDFDFITNLAKNAPFEIGALTQSFVKLKAAGLDPTLGSMQSLVDSVARFGGSGEQFNRASVAISQMLGKGVVSMEELRQQLGEAIPTAMRDMADGMGLSMAELTDKVGKGQVVASGAINKMLAQMSINNEGAAQKMMNTWVGTLARVKTEWELATLEIANAGFFTEIKKAMDEIAVGLGSNDFKRFALEMGAALGDAVRTIASFVRWVVEMRSEIAALATAFVAYKLASSFINQSNANSVAASIAKVTGEYRSQREVMLGNAMIARTTAMQSAQAEQQAALQRQVASAGVMRQKQAELAFLQAMNNQQIAEAARLQAALNSGRGANGRFISREQVSQQLARLDQLSSANRVYATRVAADAAAAGAAHAAATAAARQHAQALQTAATSTVALGRGAGIASAAMRGLATAFNALGGPLMAVNLLIAAGITYWLQRGQAAQKSLEMERRAAQGFSQEGDDRLAQKALEDAAKEMAAKGKELDDIEANKATAKRDGRIKDLEQLNARELKVMEQFVAARTIVEAKTQTLQRTQANLRRQGAEEGAALRVREFDDQIRTIRDKGGEKINALRGQMEEELKLASGNKAQEAIRARFMDQIQKAGISNAETEYGAYKAKLSELRQQLKTSSEGAKSELVEAIRRIESGMAEVENKLKLRSTIGAENVFTSTKKDGSGSGTWGEDKLKNFVAGLADDKARLDEIIKEYVTIGDSVSKVEAVRASVLAKWSAGGFDQTNEKTDKTRRPDRAVAEAAAAEAARVQALKEQVDSANRFVDRAREMGPEVERAAAYLVNPDQNGSLDQERVKFERFIAKSGISLMKLPPEIAKVVQEAMKAMESGADKIDLANIRRKQEQELSEIGTRTLEGERARARELIEIERDKTIKVLEEARVRALAAGRTGDAAIADQLIENARRIADDKIVKGGMTAMQKLAEQWRDSAKAMEDSSVGWANATSDAFVDMAATGKFAWKGLVTQILKDILRIQMQKMIAGLITNAIGAYAGAPGAGNTGALPGGSYSMSGQNVRFGGGFANGGIMSGAGSVPLKKYARGGIAKSPQLALFGEGDMNEAYVPLPDGRSIPVTMRGQSAPAVTVNVINQSGTPVSAQQGQPRFDGKQMVLDIVLDAASRPGGFRDGMRNMMTT